MPVMVHESGARGGYTYQFTNGADGHIWLIGDRQDSTQWNVRVKVESLPFSLYGYEAVKERILDILDDDLCAKGSDNNFGIPQERISRIGYCMDFIFEEPFIPELKNFICHGRTKKQKRREFISHKNGTGQYTETITLGKMPNRQITIYNKIKDITAKNSSYWWKVWGLEKNKFKKEIWRIGICAGKKELNKWNLKTFEDFEEITGDLISDILEHYKYTVPNLNDTNSTRWPKSEIWNKAISTAQIDLFSFSSKINPKIILDHLRKTNS
jgi:hypothetical protein